MAVTVRFLIGMVGEGEASEHAQIEKFMYKPSSFRLCREFGYDFYEVWRIVKDKFQKCKILKIFGIFGILENF
jgi:hypothetical protein